MSMITFKSVYLSDIQIRYKLGDPQDSSTTTGPVISTQAMEKITGLEKTFETKLDNKFNELLARLPPPPPAAPNAPLQQ